MPLDGEWRDAYDVVVVGSGFGGSVMAAELAACPRTSVCVLERGRAYPPGAFPREWDAIRKNYWAPHRRKHGLYDLKRFSGLYAVVASGLGGGSLIYANVMLRKDPSWFQQRTPNGEFTEQWALRCSDLDEHYTAVEEFLDVGELPHDVGDTTVPEDFHLAKTAQFLAAAGSAGSYAPLAIKFHGTDGRPAVGVPFPDEAYSNVHGDVARTTCSLNGECDVGCNEGAKNSLDHTYLSRASHDGARIHTLAEVVELGLDDDAGAAHRFVIGVQDHRDDTATLRIIRARRVVLAAGTFGSTELLLRNSSALGLSTPDAPVDPALGSRFCGNGDFLAAVRNTGDDVNSMTGPVITAYRRYPAETDPVETDPDAPDPGGDGVDVDRHGMYLEDAGIPDFRTWRAALVEGGSGSDLAERWADEAARGIGECADDQARIDVGIAFRAWRFTTNFLPLLGMGRDRPDGRLYLDDDDGRLRCDWSVDSSEAYFTAMDERMEAIAEELGGRYVWNPLYRLLRRVITVHPLGGCPMDTNLHEGVVDTYGRVRGVPGLRVCDGSVFPGPIGPNPSLTIAAFARRSALDLLDEWPYVMPPAAADPYEGD